ncbi:MAG TPA: hypothetical protein VFG10_18865 [Saprospiraceae bacterium]|nr:hypothetical protein [Saprospiraceae bacterium]
MATKEELTISEHSLQSFPDAVDKPEIIREDYNRLSRVDRIFQSMLWPRHFQLPDQDIRYLDSLKVAHACLRNYSTDREAMAVLKHAIPGKKLSLGEVTHLVRDAKQLFGKLIMRDADFDREKLRDRYLRNADKAWDGGDIDAERKALRAIADLDKKDASGSSKDPVIPQLPNVIFTTKKIQAEDAIIETRG